MNEWRCKLFFSSLESWLFNYSCAHNGKWKCALLKEICIWTAKQYKGRRDWMKTQSAREYNVIGSGSRAWITNQMADRSRCAVPSDGQLCVVGVRQGSHFFYIFLWIKMERSRTPTSKHLISTQYIVHLCPIYFIWFRVLLQQKNCPGFSTSTNMSNLIRL